MSARSQSALRAGLWALVLVLGAVDAFAGRQYVNADGISYVDLADAWARGDWRSAVSPYWSPLYSILLVPVVVLSRTARTWETPLAHGLNFVVFIGALVAFEFFVRSALARLPEADDGERHAARIWAYALFGRAAIVMATVQLLTPDLLVVTATFVLAGLLCRIAGGDTRTQTFVMLGFAAGLGFLAKLVMLVFALATLALAAAVTRPRRRALGGVALAVATGALVAAPFVVALSVKERRVTLGDAGRLNYIWSLRTEGRDLQPAHSVVLHASGPSAPRVIVERPRAWQFAGPGTVPFWYAPAAWDRGDSIPFSAHAQWRVIVENLLQLRYALLRPWWPAWLALLMLMLAARRGARRAGWPLWYVALGAIVPFVLYLPVHLEGRFVSAALVLLLFVVFVSLPRPEGGTRRWREAIVWLALLALLAPPMALRLRQAGEYVGGHRPPAPADVAAERLRGLGLVPGDGVAVVGNFYEAQWARVARLRVVAVVDPDEAFDTTRPDQVPPAQVAAALAAAGARAVVSDRGPAPAVAPGEWTVLDGALAARRLDR